VPLVAGKHGPMGGLHLSMCCNTMIISEIRCNTIRVISEIITLKP
jgi:hypothetical protein